MLTTSQTLLEKLRDPHNEEAWYRFCKLYAPLILSMARKRGLGIAEAEEVGQQVLLTLWRKLPTYRKQEGRTFRAWLKAVVRNKAIDFYRQKAGDLLRPCGEIPETEAPDEADLEEKEYRLELVRRVQQMVQDNFETQTWAAYTEHVVNGRPAAEVATELGMTPNAVFLARHRVLARIREQLDSLPE